MNSIIIGIAGGTGSGKSTFTNRLKNEFGDRIAVIYHDNYYRCHDDIPPEERKYINYDHPDALETDFLIEHLKILKNGEPIKCPVYDFSVHNRSSQTIGIIPKKVMIVEGILVLQNEELRNMFDIKVFVDADADERIIRRMMRDIRERGRDMEGVAEQYLSTVKKMHYLYVEPTKEYADIVINGGLNEVAYRLMKLDINSILSNQK